MSSFAVGPEKLTVVTSEPLDKNLVADIAANLGEITLYAAGSLSMTPPNKMGRQRAAQHKQAVDPTLTLPRKLGKTRAASFCAESKSVLVSTTTLECYIPLSRVARWPSHQLYPTVRSPSQHSLPRDWKTRRDGASGRVGESFALALRFSTVICSQPWETLPGASSIFCWPSSSSLP